VRKKQIPQMASRNCQKLQGTWWSLTDGASFGLPHSTPQPSNCSDAPPSLTCLRLLSWDSHGSLTIISSSSVFGRILSSLVDKPAHRNSLAIGLQVRRCHVCKVVSVSKYRQRNPFSPRSLFFSFIRSSNKFRSVSRYS
jgi:hypothetical protein